MKPKAFSVKLVGVYGNDLNSSYRHTFSHEGRDALIKNELWDAGVVGHGVFLHALEGRQLHDSADNLIRERQVQVPHDALHFTSRILVEHK